MKSLFHSLTLALILFIPHFSFGQSLDWVSVTGSTVGVIATDMDHDNLSGNTYICGYFTGDADLDPGISELLFASNGDRDIYIQKINDTGELTWARRIGGIGDDRARAIAIDPDGNIYITGYFSEEVDFNPGLGEFVIDGGILNDSFVLKLDSNGSFIWVNPIDGTGYTEGRTIACDLLGNVYTGGIFTETLDADPGVLALPLQSAGFEDGFIQKLNSAGQLQWARHYGSADFDAVSHIAIAPYEVIVAGEFALTVDFDPTKNTAELTEVEALADVFLLALSPEGNLEWLKGFQGSETDYSAGLTSDQTAIYLAINFQGDLDVDPGAAQALISAQNNFNSVVIGLLPSGEMDWYAALLAASSFMTESLFSNSSSLWVCGMFTETVDLNPGNESFTAVSSGSTDHFILELDSSGDFLRGFNQGGFGGDVCQAVWPGQDDELYVLGTFNQAMDMDPDSDELPFSPSGNLSSSLQNLRFCMEATILDSNNELTALPSGMSYQWIDCLTDELLDGATSQIFTPSESGLYYVQVYDDVCNDYSICIDVTVGVSELLTEANLSVYPNPATHFLRIESPKRMADSRFTLKDATGRIVSRDQPLNGMLDIEFLAPGLYILSDGMQSIRWVKQ